VKFGYLGVTIFFVLSGFCVHAAATRSTGVGDYIWRRLVRIYPPFWASLLLVAAVSVGRKLVVGANDVGTWPKTPEGFLALATALVTPATRVGGVNWVYWTLSFELAFYLITTMAVVYPRVFVAFAAALTLIAALPDWWNGVPGLFFLSYWPVYALGVGVSLLARREWFGGAAVSVAAVAVVVTRSSGPGTAVAILTAAVIGMAAAGLTDRFRPPRVLIQCGMVSYSLYLTHVPIGCWICLRWKTGQWATNPWLALAYDIPVLLICILGAIVSYRLVEVPSLRMARSGVRPTSRVPIPEPSGVG
jgi:peptidoglycan/LPS O-acetylase OafA/YrhL